MPQSKKLILITQPSEKNSIYNGKLLYIEDIDFSMQIHTGIDTEKRFRMSMNFLQSTAV